MASAALGELPASIGNTGWKIVSLTASSAGLSAVARERGGPAEQPREHRGASHRVGCDGVGARDRFGHDAIERALPQFADQQPTQEVGLGLGGASEERVQRRSPSRDRLASGRRL
jgi:hypothetical protein